MAWWGAGLRLLLAVAIPHDRGRDSRFPNLYGILFCGERRAFHVLENAAEMGVKLPKFLANALAKLSQKSDDEDAGTGRDDSDENK